MPWPEDNSERNYMESDEESKTTGITPTTKSPISIIGSESNLPARTSKGQFPKGTSGNAQGRPKGSRNAITLTRLATEHELRDYFKPHAKKVLARAVDIALKGDPSLPATIAMIRTLLDKSMSSLRNEDVGDTKDNNVIIQFNRLLSSRVDQHARENAIDVEVLPPKTQTPSE